MKTIATGVMRWYADIMVCLMQWRWCVCVIFLEHVGVLNIKKQCNGVSGEWQLFSYNRCLHDTRVFFGLQMQMSSC
jgi:hypothetical protein